MRIPATYRGHLIVAAIILAGAGAVLGVLTPAVSDQVRPLLQSLAIISCSSSNPCQEGDNSSTGPGLEGISSSGSGAIGLTKSNGTSGKAGLLGEDSATTGNFNSGVEGTSVRSSGVFGVSQSGPGVKGTSITGFGISAVTSGGSSVAALNALTAGSGSAAGVMATSTNGIAVNAHSTNAQGMIVRSTNHDGIDVATSHNSKTTGFGRSAVFAHDDSTDGGTLNFGVFASTQNGTGIFASSTNGVGLSAFSSGGNAITATSTNGAALLGTSTNFVAVNAIGGFNNGVDIGYPALSVIGNSTGGIANYLIAACPTGTANVCDIFSANFLVRPNGSVDVANSSGTFVFDADEATGNVNITGQYRKNGSCVSGCIVATSTSKGHAVVTYASQVSQPTVEDFGEAQLAGGQAYVGLDPKFANVIDQRTNYLVFITPEGDANVLYVTQKSPGGFAVRESHGGRSTIAFSYRIVAKPYGEPAARLPMVELPTLRHSRLSHARPRA